MHGEERAVKQHLAVARHADGGEVLDVGEIPELIGPVLDVEPAEFDARKLLAQGKKAGTVFDARIAPLGAQAGNFDGGHG